MTLTEVLTIIALFGGPIAAVQISEYLGKRWAARQRTLGLFKTLMSTRASTMHPNHIEALNMIDVEFDNKDQKGKKVISAWKLYLDHLYGDPSKPDWPSRKSDLLIDLLLAMAEALGYDFDKVHIKKMAYYPKGYGERDEDQLAIRKGLLELIDGKRTLPVIVVPFPVDQLPPKPQGQGPDVEQK